MRCTILDAPIHEGAGRPGCEMGPSALRAAGLAAVLAGLGHELIDLGTIAPAPRRALRHPNAAVRALPEIAAWTESIADAAYAASADAMPIVLGGDHSMAAGTLSGLARRAAEVGQPLFVLWVDAHADFHTLDSTESGNLHGVPLAYAAGQPGFAGHFPDLAAPVDPARICLFGVRSIDAAEERALRQAGVAVHDMRAIAKHGSAPLLRLFLDRVAAEGGRLHVSFDVDALDPAIAPAVGTATPGGLAALDAREAMALLRDSGLVTSLDVAELNPLLDEHGRTARLLVELTASLMGRRDP
jgi:arginase